MQERLEKRTRTSRTYIGPNDRNVVRVYPEAVNYERPDGTWRAIDNSFVRSASPEHRWRNAANRFRADLPANVGDEPLRIATDTHWLTMKPTGAAGQGVASGPRVRYASALPGVDLEYVAGEDSLKEDIVLSGPAAPHTFRFAIAASAGLTAHETASGAIAFRDADGAVAFTMAPPFMYDQRGISRGRSDAVDLSVERSSDGFVITLDADDAWLDDPERQFPVRLDPTVLVGQPGTDCFLVGGKRMNKHLCGAPYLDVGFDGFQSGDPAGQASRGLLKFDLSSIPAGSQILEADLGVYLWAGRSLRGLAVSAHPITAAWTQAATWNNATLASPWATPGGDHAPEPADINPEVAGWTHFEHWYLPDLVQDWLDGAVPNHGVLLKALQESGNVNTTHTFASSNDPSLDRRPRLEISYRAPIFDDRAPTPPTGLSYRFNGADGTAELDWFTGSEVVNSDGTPGSGVAFDEFRTRKGSGAWTEWASSSAEDLVIVDGLVSGDVLDVEVRTVDIKGNASTTTSATFTMPGSDAAQLIDPCYRQATPYAFPFGGPDTKGLGTPFNVPDCRQAPSGTEDARTGNQTAYTRAFRRYPTMKTNPDQGGRRKWAIKDSFNNVFAWLSQIHRSGSNDTFVIYAADGRTQLGRTTRTQVELRLQGRACMETEALEDGHIMMALYAADFGDGPKAFGTQDGVPGPVYLGIRGFIREDALPATGLGKPGSGYADNTTADIANRFDVNCSQNALGLKESTTVQPTTTDLNPVFRFDDKYKGEQGRSGGGNRYSNYNGFPDPNQNTFDAPPQPARPDIVKVVKIMATTTGVYGGGVVRAIVPPTASFAQYDSFAYRDPNVVCESRPAPSTPTARWPARWSFVKLSTPRTIEGWTPQRVASPTEKACSNVGQPFPGGE